MKNVEIFNSPMFGELRTSRNEKGEPIFCLKDVCDSLGLQVGAVVNRLNACHISSINVSKAKEDATPYISSINVGVKTGTKSDGTAVIPANKTAPARAPTASTRVFRLISI